MSGKPLLTSLAERLGLRQPQQAEPSLAARVAARWWGDCLRGPALLDHIGAEGYKDPSRVDIMTIGLAKTLQAQEREAADLSEERITLFEQKLAALIDEQLGDRSYAFSLGVDYHPDWILQQAAQAAGVNVGMTILPWKTRMSVEPTEVRVSEGYRAEAVSLELVEPELAASATAGPSASLDL